MHASTEAVFSELDKALDEEELLSVLKKLKCGRAAGTDYLLNEYFVTFKDFFLPV